MTRFVLLAALLASGQALAFNTLKYGYGGGTITWSAANVPVPWALDPAGCADTGFTKAQAAIQAAFQSWQDVTCSTIAFSYAGTANPSTGIWLRFQNTTWDPGVDGAAAYSVTTDYTYAGNIRKNEVVFNDVDLVWTDQNVGPYSTTEDIQGVAAHELGHSIGLDHSFHIDATMYFTAGGADMRTLEPDDQHGACFLYPTTPFTQGAVCDACDADSNCVSGGCVKYPDNNRYCGQACTSDSQCPDHTFCYIDASQHLSTCASDNVRCDQGGANLGLGEYCWGMEGCQSGLCLAMPGDAYCSKTCNPAGANTCGTGYSCLGEGSDGYCVKAGQVPFGGACSTNLECATSTCAMVCSNVAICVKSCTTAAQCPANSTCQQQLCIPNGPTPFGGTCSCVTECATGYCTGLFGGSFCSRTCSTDADCPESKCGTSGVCSKPTGAPGAGCKQDSSCGADMFCKFASASAPDGTCALKCDPVADTGCAAGQACVWVYMGWLDKVYGECKPKNGGASELQACTLSGTSCEVDLICADEGKGPICYRDCKTTSALGCDFDKHCVGMNLAEDPKHGLCVPYDQPVVEPAPDVVTTADAALPDDTAVAPIDTTAGNPDATTGDRDTTSSSPDGGGSDPGSTGQPDVRQPGDDTGGAIERGDSGSGCAVRDRAAPGGAWVWLAGLAALALRRRRVVG